MDALPAAPNGTCATTFPKVEPIGYFQLMVIASAEGIAGITAVATVCTGLMVVVITARTTSSRLERQLQAETERHTASLAHGRELADIADLRGLLDEAAIVVDQLGFGLRSVSMALTMSGSQDDFETEMRWAEKKFRKAGIKLTDLRARLRVRLGQEDPIATAIESVRNTADDMAGLYIDSVLQDYSNEEIEEKARAIREAFEAASRAFYARAVERAGTIPGHAP